MAENIEHNLELEKILATLANLPKPETTQPYLDQHQTHDHVPGYEGFQDTQIIYPPQQHLSLLHQSPADPRLTGRPTPTHRHPPTAAPPPPPRPQDRASTPLIDPSTITEWKQGLRCVSKIATQNAEFAPSVRKLMKDQEQNVKSWEAGRMRLLDDHKMKRENEQTHRAALSLPGLLEGTAMLRTPEREKEELNHYDAKVYRACKAMVDSQASSLKVLGVPFFGIKPYLIVHSHEQPKEAGDAGAGAGEHAPATVEGKGKVTREELLELQRKMLNHLMELYGD